MEVREKARGRERERRKGVVGGREEGIGGLSISKAAAGNCEESNNNNHYHFPWSSLHTSQNRERWCGGGSRLGERERDFSSTLSQNALLPFFGTAF